MLKGLNRSECHQSIQRIFWVPCTWNVQACLTCIPCSLVTISFAVLLVSQMGICRAEERFRQPVYRIANQPDLAPSSVGVPSTTEGLGFDLTPRPGEHPLAPVLRLAKQGLRDIDTKIQDYSCKVTKRERIDGELGENQFLFARVRHEPYSVYMYFVNPFEGREVLYVDNPNNYQEGKNGNKLAVLAEGLKRRLGVLHLDPLGDLAMNGQKYPITKFGIRNLTAELIQVAEQDVQYGECIVNINDKILIEDRPATRIEVIHPVPRKNFRYHIARIYVDHELRIPVRYSSWMWPTYEGEKPPLEEQYTYTDIKINNGYTDQTFSESNPDIFKR